MFLAIDTSSSMASLSLSENNRLLAEMTWECEQNHTVQLLPHLNILLQSTAKTVKDITCIAVARGPGSFNGLRVGISTAKGLSYSLGVPVIGISTLEAESWQFAFSGLPVCAVHNAGRSEIAAAIYQYRRKQWQRLAEEHITTVDGLLGSISVKTVFCGEYVAQIREELMNRLKTKAVIPPQSALPRRAFFLAELGENRLADGQCDAPAALQPLYLRRPQITERKHQ
jgi:tRNA threonylcarbamoyl adenosine modification protein YeaZ